jgi:hypothetical protein
LRPSLNFMVSHQWQRSPEFTSCFFVGFTLIHFELDSIVVVTCPSGLLDASY